MNYDLSEVLAWVEIKSEKLNIKVSDLSLDSRKIQSNGLFIALSGNDNHGIDFAYQAQRAGACAIFAETVLKGKAEPKSRQQTLSIPIIEIDNLSDKLGHLASNFYKNPSEKLEIIGITGTNGKTSCAWLLLQAWKNLGIKAGYIGTLGYGTISQMKSQPNTTPTAVTLQKILAYFVEKNITHVSLEVSSHGLDLGRVNSCEFKGVGFTNISRDHLDFHGSMENYAKSKEKLFLYYESDFAVINHKDYYGKKWINKVNNSICSYAVDDYDANLNASEVKLSPKGIEFTINYNTKSYKVFTKLLGHFNVDNILLVVGTLINQGYDISRIVELIKDFQPVPGRMNRVGSNKKGPLIIVDYAHTPDALEQVLLALRQHNSRKTWCIFGCGGNRDKGKRPLMGRIAETLANQVIVTDDNPRYENNVQITKDILKGMETTPRVIHNRKDAIMYAIDHAHSKDLILIAGKGHEPYQLISGQYHPFDDRAIASELLNSIQEKCA